MSSKRKRPDLAALDRERARAEGYVIKWSQGGHTDLGRYRKIGSGLHLFRAYVKRRKADQQKIAARRRKLQSKLEGNLATWKPSDGHDSLTAWQAGDGYTAEIGELATLDILDELDPIIDDLLKFCESPDSANGQRLTRNQQLTRLHKALRIDARRSPTEAKLVMKKNHAVHLFHFAYLAMISDDNPTFKSERVIARDIEEKTGINWRSAVRYWQQAKHTNRAFDHLAKEASARAKALG